MKPQKAGIYDIVLGIFVFRFIQQNLHEVLRKVLILRRKKLTQALQHNSFSFMIMLVAKKENSEAMDGKRVPG